MKKFNEFLKENNIIKNLLPQKDGYLIFNGKYLADWEIETTCGGKGKISEMFTDFGYDDDGYFIANCTHCHTNGVIMTHHIKRNHK